MNDQQKEEYLASKLKEFTDKLAEVAKDVISDVHCEYLPHVMSDTELNVKFQTEQALQDILKGAFTVQGDYIRIGELMVWIGNSYDQVCTNIYNNAKDKIESNAVKELSNQTKKWQNLYYSK